MRLFAMYAYLGISDGDGDALPVAIIPTSLEPEGQMLSISPQLEEPEPGFEISPNFGEIFRFRLIPGKNISVFSENFVLKIQNSKKIGRNSPKFAKIPEQNSVSADHRDFTGKRNG